MNTGFKNMFCATISWSDLDFGDVKPGLAVTDCNGLSFILIVAAHRGLSIQPHSPNESPSVQHTDAMDLCIKHTRTDRIYYAIDPKCILNISAEHIGPIAVDNCMWNVNCNSREVKNTIMVLLGFGNVSDEYDYFNMLVCQGLKKISNTVSCSRRFDWARTMISSFIQEMQDISKCKWQQLHENNKKIFIFK